MVIPPDFCLLLTSFLSADDILTLLLLDNTTRNILPPHWLAYEPLSTRISVLLRKTQLVEK